ncbi:hypothetical protein OROHE_021544 [Orobanche hederae]
MGKTLIGSQPDSELGIKVQPRVNDPRSAGGPPVPYPSDKFRYPPIPPPPQPYHLSPKKWFPWLVPTIVTVNIVVFIIVMYINNCPANPDDKCVGESTLGRFAFQSTHENPLLGPSTATLLVPPIMGPHESRLATCNFGRIGTLLSQRLLKIGALEVKKVVEERQVWRLLSCMWLHAGTFHVLANMLSLFFFGLRLEQEFGFE